MISIDVETKKITKLDNNINDLNTVSCLKIENDWICASIQGYNRKPSLVNFLIFNYLL